MSINATFQFTASTSGGTQTPNSYLNQVFKDIYTVLKLDYTFERKCNDRTGRPEGGIIIKAIKVTLRGVKESKAVFHQWIAANDMLKNGEIKIYDSSGIISSSIQDATGIKPIIDVDETYEFVAGFAKEPLTTAMDDASDYENRDFDMYDELSHAQLMKQAREKGIVVNSKDSDDDIRDLLRQWDKVDDDDVEKVKVDGKETKIDDMDLDALKSYAEKHNIAAPEDKSQTMKKAELQAYVTKYNLTVTKEGDEPTEEELRTAVSKHMQKVGYQQQIKNSEKGIKARKKMEEERIKHIASTPAYKEADLLKERTVSSLEGAGKAAVKRNIECARCIEFYDAYCVSLRELFTNAPDSTGKLDKFYPWTLEIGIKPKNVVVYGELLFNRYLSKNDDTSATFDGLYS